MNRTMKSDDNDDVRAEREAEQARLQGTRLIRDHLENHLRQNPDSSFVTWVATLHPENAEVTIDTRFFVENNPWWTVYEETKVGIPVAIPVEDEDGVVATEGGTRNEMPGTDVSTPVAVGLVDSIVGYSLLFASVISTVSLEVAILVLTVLGNGFQYIVDATDPRRCSGITCLIVAPFFGVFWICRACIVLCAFIVTLVSSLVVELLAAVTFGVMLFLTCFSREKALGWHQFLRKLTHHVRWASRSYFWGSSTSTDVNNDGDGIDDAVIKNATMVSIVSEGGK